MSDNEAEFFYIDESSISTYLKCPLCSTPYVDPVIRSDGTRLCRACALLCDDEAALIPVTETILLGMLDDLPVGCRRCGKKNIPRKDFPKHWEVECPQRVVRCPAADLTCSWRGLQDELDEHLGTCPFEPLRSCLMPLLTDTKALKKELDYRWKTSQTEKPEHRDAVKETKTELDSGLLISLEETRETTMRLYSRMTELERAIGTLSKPSLPASLNNDVQTLRDDFDQFKALYEKEAQRNRHLENELKRLLMDFDRQRAEIEHLTSRLYELNQQEGNENGNHATLTEQVEHLNNELALVKQRCHEQDIQIRLLARTRCVLPVTSNYRNESLENVIEQFPPNDHINLSEQKINDADLDGVYKKAVVEKQCQELRLDQNQLTVKSAISLSVMLTNNTKLTALYLSNNKLNDTGVHIIAQTLAINNDTLTLLELNNNDLTDQSAEYLSEMLKINRGLRSLSLDSNRITDHGAQLLMQAVSHFNTHLQNLSLRHNSLITDKTVETISAMLQRNISLRSLHIDNCGLSENGIRQLEGKASLKTDFELSC